MEWIEEVEGWRKEYVESIELPDLAALPFPGGWERGDYKNALLIENETLWCKIFIEHQDSDKRLDKENEMFWDGKRYWVNFWRNVVDGELDEPYDPSRRIDDRPELFSDDCMEETRLLRHSKTGKTGSSQEAVDGVDQAKLPRYS
jgi:hypothetical protein